MDGEWESLGGLGEEEVIDEIGLSYESMDMLATMVDPGRSYVWSFTGTRIPAVKNAMVKSPLSARVIFNIDEGEVNVLDIARKHPTDYLLGDEEVTVFVVQEFHQNFVDELDDVRHDPIEVTLCRNVKKDLLKSLDSLSGGKDDDCTGQFVSKSMSISMWMSTWRTVGLVMFPFDHLSYHHLNSFVMKASNFAEVASVPNGRRSRATWSCSAWIHFALDSSQRR